MDAACKEWLAALGEAVVEAGFVRAQVAKPTPGAGDLKSVDVRPILVKRILKLSFTYHHKTRDIVKNYEPREAEAVLARLLRESFAAGRLYTLAGDVFIHRKGKGFELARQAASEGRVPDLSHDKAKTRVARVEKPYLHALGITDAGGAVLKSAQDKFRQIDKYVEIVDGLVKQLGAKKRLRVVDMGAGKGYLTFALHDHLTHTLGLEVETVGVEHRPDMVALCNRIARECGYGALRFVKGSIADYDCAGADVVIALHACDTATDDALAKAVLAGAGLIVAAPCCHKQVRREMGKGRGKSGLDFLLKYGTYVERVAEMVTDGLRARMLEISGYRTHVFEFVSGVHTPKNVMIVAVKGARPAAPDEARLRAEVARVKEDFGIRFFELERLLG